MHGSALAKRKTHGRATRLARLAVSPQNSARTGLESEVGTQQRLGPQEKSGLLKHTQLRRTGL
jgi:hypothetical protein